MKLPTLGNKYLRITIFVLGFTFGSFIGFLVNEHLTRQETKIENTFGKIKNKKGNQEVEQTQKTEIDNSKKKEKKKFLFW